MSILDGLLRSGAFGTPVKGGAIGGSVGGGIRPSFEAKARLMQGAWP